MEGLLITPVLGADFRSIEQFSWNINASVQGGLEWSHISGKRRLRLLLNYYRGRNPYGQFFNQKVEVFGVGFYFQL
jgi:hypothetical protein